MKINIISIAAVILLLFIAISCIISESSWAIKKNGSDDLRHLLGLPSLAVGNLNPSARNPGVEILCVAMYDYPGGYCRYFTPGLPYTNLVNFNITIGESK